MYEPKNVWGAHDDKEVYVDIFWMVALKKSIDLLIFDWNFPKLIRIEH